MPKEVLNPAQEGSDGRCTTNGKQGFPMRNLTIIAFLMATTSLASAAGNEFFIGQIGDTNNALVGQNNGNNKQGTIQAGKKNSAMTLAERSGSRTQDQHSPARPVRRLQQRARRPGRRQQHPGHASRAASATSRSPRRTARTGNGKTNNSSTAQFGYTERLGSSTRPAATTTEHAAGRRWQLLGHRRRTTRRQR